MFGFTVSTTNEFRFYCKSNGVSNLHILHSNKIQSEITVIKLVNNLFSFTFGPLKGSDFPDLKGKCVITTGESESTSLLTTSLLSFSSFVAACSAVN